MSVFVNRGVIVAFALFAPQAAPAAPAVVFLDGNAARAAIVNDARDPYFARLQPLDMAAKTGSELTGTPDQQRAEARRRYQQAVRPFRPEEQQAIRAYIEALAPMLRDYPRFARQPWRFVKVADHIEGGLPHTRDDVIVLSEQVGRQLFDMRRQQPEDAALLRAGMLLAHEQVHVLQRLAPQRFEALYTKSFGFRRVPPLVLTAELVANEVVNPDGLSCCWLYPRADGGYLLPFLVYAERRGLRRMPDDFRMLAVRVEPDGAGHRIARGADGHARTEDLERVTEFVEAFPLTRNYYHPNETAADLFAQLVLFDGMASARMPAAQREALEPAFAPLRSAFRAVFAK